MALSAHAGLHVARAGPLVRHRIEGDVGGSEQDFREEVGIGLLRRGRLRIVISLDARVAELADALDSGSSE